MINEHDQSILIKLISENELSLAIEKLKLLFKNTPFEQNVLHLAAQDNELKSQLIAGTITMDDATIVKNKLRVAIFDFLEMVENPKQQPKNSQENQATTPISGKNIVVGTIANVSGNFIVGDNNQT